MNRLDGYLKIREAARFLGVCPNTLRNWGRESKIPEYRHPINNYCLYRQQDLEALLRRIVPPGRPGTERRSRGGTRR